MQEVGFVEVEVGFEAGLWVSVQEVGLAVEEVWWVVLGQDVSVEQAWWVGLEEG